MNTNDKIRVGLIRCDTHGAYYMGLMEEYDPLVLRGPLRGTDVSTYSWQTGAAHYYFHTCYGDPALMTVPSLREFTITRIWDEHEDATEDMAIVLNRRPKICKNYDEVSDDVDLVMIADCNEDGSDHLKLATPSLTKGVPTFVDKPFSSNLKDALAMVELAERTGTPLLSLSILREVPQFTMFKNRVPEVGDFEFGTVKGLTPKLVGAIHAISVAQHLIGYGVESVECMGQNPWGHILLHYGDGPDAPKQGMMLNCDAGRSPDCCFHASLYGSAGAIHSPGIGDWVFPYGALNILEKIVAMVRTGKPQVDYNEMIENVAVIEAAELARNSNRAVKISELWQPKTLVTA